MTILLRPSSATQNHSQTGQESFEKLPQDLKRPIQKERALLEGKGALLRFENAVSRFLREASDPALVLGMAAGQLLFAPVRAGLLYSLWNPAAKKYLLGPLVSRFLAAGVASSVEAPVFWSAGKWIEQGKYSKGAVSWNLKDGSLEMMNLWGTMGVLRLSGFSARSLLPVSSRSHPFLVSAAASVAGLYLAHWGQEQMGWRENHGNWDRWVDALLGTFQFAMTGAAVQRLLGPRFQSFNARLEHLLEQHKNSWPQFPQLFPQGDPSIAWAGGILPARRAQPLPETIAGPTLNKITDHPSYGGSASTDPTQSLILEVIKRGKNSELLRLKKIILETYRDRLGFKPSERTERYFKSNDWEEWKTGIRILSLGNESTPLQVARALRDNPAFLEFAEEWKGQPHFESPSDLPVEMHGPISRSQPATLKYFEKLRRALFDSPTQVKLQSFLATEGPGSLRTTRRTTELLHEWEHAESPSGEKLYAGRVGNVGVVLEFSEKGYLASPVHMFALPSSEWVKANLAAYARGEAWEAAPPIAPTEKKPSAPEILIEYLEGTKRHHAFDQITGTIRKILAAHPDERAIKKIFDRYKGRLGDTIPEPVQLPGGQWAYAYNRGNYHGLILRFDEKGKLLTPIHIGNFFGPEKLGKIKDSLRKGDWNGVASISTAPPAAPPQRIETLFLPSKEDNPTNYALKFMVESRDTSEFRQQQLSKSLEGLLKASSTRDFAVEMLERLESLTRSLRPEGLAVVRKFSLEGLENPLMIYKPTTISLPEAWSQLFAQRVRSELQKSGKAGLLVELGSDSGWISIYLRKLGLVEESIGIDPRLIGRLVGRVNAMANQVDGAKLTQTRFEKADRWDQLPLFRRADWVVAAVPAHEPILKTEGWDLVSNTLYRARSYLNPGGRIIFGLEGDQHLDSLLKIFKDHGISTALNHETPLSTLEVFLPR